MIIFKEGGHLKLPDWIIEELKRLDVRIKIYKEDMELDSYFRENDFPF